MTVPAGTRREVVARAKSRCEYCGLAQAGQEAAFHVDHIEPRVAGGPTELPNLALACVSCSLRKAARWELIDPKTGILAQIFHPRRQDWRTHFEWVGLQIVGMTPTGRATVDALQLNRPIALAIRASQLLPLRSSPDWP